MICVKRVDTYKIYKTNNILQNTIKLKFKKKLLIIVVYI
jgi:hypothetical protein